MVELISGLGLYIVEYMFGGPLIAGLALFMIMIFYGLGMRFTGDCWLACMPSLIWTVVFHPETALLPVWLWGVAAVVMGIIIGLGAIRVFNRR